MKKSISISALIACFTLTGLSVQAKNQKIFPGADISNKIASHKLKDAAAAEIMQTLATTKIGNIWLTNWSEGNGFIGFNLSGSGYTFGVDIEKSGNFTVTSDNGRNVILKGKLSAAAQAGLSGKTTFETSLYWDIVEPRDDKGKVDRNAKLIIRFRYTYRGIAVTDQIQVGVTINDVLEPPVSGAPDS